LLLKLDNFMDLRMTVRLVMMTVLVCVGGTGAAGKEISLPAETAPVLRDIYSGRFNHATSEARAMQLKMPEHPLGYLLEAEASWWKIWCTSAEFKYGMTMPRHREKLAADQGYLNLVAKAYSLAEKNLHTQETAEMDLYAGMADALAARLYGLRAENRTAARAGVRARGYFMRALKLDPSLGDACLGLGLYNYYVDTLSSMARVLRFMMGIPGGNKEEGIRLLHRAVEEGELSPAEARFYLAINLHNYEHRYKEALESITPLAEKYPENPLFAMARGDLLAKLGRKEQARKSYEAAEAAKLDDPECQRHVDVLLRESMAGLEAN
jgi:tetratricopeptide (TPR) repeat protein